MIYTYYKISFYCYRIDGNLNEENKLKGDFLKETNKWALDSISSIALDMRIGTIGKKLSENDQAGRLIKVTQDIFIYGEKLDFRPSLWRIFPTKTFRDAMKTYQEQIE